MTGDEAMVAAGELTVPRMVRVGAFLGGAFTAAFGFGRGTFSGLAMGVGGLATMLWGLRELARFQDAMAGEDIVAEASEESFPASDAPSWTPTSRAGGPKIH